jgi:hypothetical protein
MELTLRDEDFDEVFILGYLVAPGSGKRAAAIRTALTGANP